MTCMWIGQIRIYYSTIMECDFTWYAGWQACLPRPRSTDVVSPLPPGGAAVVGTMLPPVSVAAMSPSQTQVPPY